jgi:hypothetical protein
MFSHTVLSITPTCFGHSCDHLRGVVQCQAILHTVHVLTKCVKRFYNILQYGVHWNQLKRILEDPSQAF